MSTAVSRMPSGSKTRVRMNAKNGSFAAASTAALTRIQPNVEGLYFVPGSNSSFSFAKSRSFSPSTVRWQGGAGFPSSLLALDS
jgi:hypothetical protein